jgi:hypothetical protein
MGLSRQNKQNVWEDMGWINFDQDKFRWRFFVKKLMSI